MATFLEFSSEEVINPDAAMEAMEQLAAELQSLPEDARIELAKQFEESADKFHEPAKVKFIKSLPETLGLV